MLEPNPVHPDKVAAYIRWSTDEQSDGTTLEVQLEACKHYVASQGWNLNEQLIFIDDGHSGGSLDRPGLTALRKAIDRGEVQCVVVFKLDRLSRSVLDTVKLVLEEWERRCYVKSAREPVDTSNPNGKMFFYMLASYAEWERNVIRERTMSGKVSRARQGKNPGIRPPYGYKLGTERGTFAIREDEAPIVERIFREYLKHGTARQIACDLNVDGIRPRYGHQWHITSVLKIISNPIYAGTLVYGKFTTASPQDRKRGLPIKVPTGRPPIAEVGGAVPALISREDFQRAQQIHADRARIIGKRAVVSEFLLTGIIFCPCGRVLEGSRDSRGGHRYYRCTSYRNSREGCGAGLVPAPRAEAEVLARVRAVYDPTHRAELLRAYEDEMVTTERQANEELIAAKAALEELSRRRQRLDASFDNGEISGRLYERRNNELEELEQRLQERRGRAETRLQELQRTQIDMAAIDERATQIDAWDDLTVAQRKELLRWAVEKVTAFRHKRSRAGGPSQHPVEIDLSIRKPSWVRYGVNGQEGEESAEEGAQRSQANWRVPVPAGDLRVGL